MRSGQILWPTDFSETAAHALSYAIEMANLYNVGLKILHVVEYPVGDENFMILSITPEELANSMEEVAATKMQALLDGLNTALPITTLIRHGDPVKQILEEANSKEIGMVVIASHGRTGISHFLHTNVSEAVANGAVCPVLVVK